ncbi:DUF3558 domain-containing protein [Nocardia harenae]|uniref:DUF3558 domain-containing protein n=1 Tax=Nocardia harenae TaxID=358707 RepID=UPI0012ED9310|nr:DUF3558 domain-containing protein [Nocardia harenae]
MLAVVPLVAGCESGTGGTAVPSSVAPEALFDSCTLPDSAIAAAGGDPARKDDNPFGVPRTGWRGCRWGSDGYALRIFATTRTPDEFRSNDQLKDLRAAELPGRDATFFLQSAATESNNCGVFYATTQGTIQIYLVDDGLGDELADPCGVALRAAKAVDQWIPR